jgi:hypothetical protein
MISTISEYNHDFLQDQNSQIPFLGSKICQLHGKPVKVYFFLTQFAIYHR